jgi:hypothetical protein
MVVLIIAGYYGIVLRFDWWLYYFKSATTKRDVQTLTRRIAATSLPVLNVGNVRYGDQYFPLQGLMLKRPNASRMMCVIAGMHGNEPAGTEAALRMAGDLGHHSDLYPHLNFMILPLANPWGWAHDLRHNGENKDVARNFVTGGTAESAIIKHLLEKAKCDLLIDLHEDRLRSGMYMLTYENADIHSMKEITQDARSQHMPIYSGAPDGIYHVRESQFASVSRTTLSMYARMQGVAQSYIVETPMRLDWEKRLTMDRFVMDRLFNLQVTH